MGACATKPKVVKDEREAMAPAPAPEEKLEVTAVDGDHDVGKKEEVTPEPGPEKMEAAASRVEEENRVLQVEVVGDDHDQSVKPRSLSNLFKENEGNEEKEVEKSQSEQAKVGEKKPTEAKATEEPLVNEKTPTEPVSVYPEKNPEAPVAETAVPGTKPEAIEKPGAPVIEKTAVPEAVKKPEAPVAEAPVKVETPVGEKAADKPPTIGTAPVEKKPEETK